MEVCFFLYNFVIKDTQVRNRVFFSRLGYLMNVARNGLIMLLKTMEMYFLFGICRLYSGDVYVTTKLYRKPLQLQLCFTGTVVEELPTGFPCFTKHYKDAANKNLLLQSVNMERRAGTLINF